MVGRAAAGGGSAVCRLGALGQWRGCLWVQRDCGAGRRGSRPADVPPGPEVEEQVRALRWWDGRGMVMLYDADLDAGAMLLERLSTPLTTRPVDEAVAVLGQLMRRLAVPAPEDARSTAVIVAERSAALEREWERLGRPFDAGILRAALDVAPALTETNSEFAVNGDLHSDQVLAGAREDWLTVDPVLLRGDIEYDLGRVLWTRLDEMTDIAAHFDIAVTRSRPGSRPGARLGRLPHRRLLALGPVRRPHRRPRPLRPPHLRHCDHMPRYCVSGRGRSRGSRSSAGSCRRRSSRTMSVPPATGSWPSAVRCQVQRR